MALRKIVTGADDALRKKSKEVKNFGERTHALLDDMWETMREADGVGLAAPQVGVLRRAVVIDVTQAVREEGDGEGAADGKDSSSAPKTTEGAGDSGHAAVNAPGGARYELLNPEIAASEGEVCDREGCLSVPGVIGIVKRPERVTVNAVDRDGNALVVEGEGLLAKALCHEIDHLEGVLFTDIAEEIVDAETPEVE